MESDNSRDIQEDVEEEDEQEQTEDEESSSHRVYSKNEVEGDGEDSENDAEEIEEVSQAATQEKALVYQVFEIYETLSRDEFEENEIFDEFL